MNENALDTVTAWIAGGQRVAVATVADVQRSAPLPVGTRLAISSEGGLAGAVSGGCVEAAIVEMAEEILTGQSARLMRYGLSDDDAWDIGLPCGGEIAVWVEEVQSDGVVHSFLELAAADERAVLIRAVDTGRALLLRGDDTSEGTLGTGPLDDTALAVAREAMSSQRAGTMRLPDIDTEVFIEVTAPRPRLIIVGAVDFGAHLVTAARLAGWRPVVIDPRPRFADPVRFPGAEAVIAAWPEQALAQLPPLDATTAVAILTHDPKVDDPALAIALRSEAGYIGAMGSRPAQRRRRARLLEAGFSNAEIDRISAPIGLDIGAQNAGETAISIMAEIIAVRHARGGGRLIEATGRIHDTTAPAASGDESSDQPGALLF